MMSLSTRLFNPTNVTIYFFFFLSHVRLSQVKVHQCKGIQLWDLLWVAPERSYDSEVTLQSNFLGHKYLLTRCPQGENSYIFSPPPRPRFSLWSSSTRGIMSEAKTWATLSQEEWKGKGPVFYHSCGWKAVLNRMASLSSCYCTYITRYLKLYIEGEGWTDAKYLSTD